MCCCCLQQTVEIITYFSRQIDGKKNGFSFGNFSLENCTDSQCKTMPRFYKDVLTILKHTCRLRIPDKIACRYRSVVNGTLNSLYSFETFGLPEQIGRCYRHSLSSCMRTITPCIQLFGFHTPLRKKVSIISGFLFSKTKFQLKSFPIFSISI